MDWDIFPKGFLLGISIAAPVGPIGVLAIRRTLSGGFGLGFATGLGAATADAFYGLIAAFGLTAIMSALVDHSRTIRLVGGLMLIYLGIRGLLHARSAIRAREAPAQADITRITAYAQTVGLTLTNPMTIISFIGMFAGVGVVESGADIWSAMLLVAGVAVGSASWWLTLATVTAQMRHRLPNSAVNAINVGSSFIILAFGLAALVASR